MDENKKFIPVSAGKTEVVKTEGEKQEHQITFVASSANPDRAQEIVEIGTFKLPLKGGGSVRVAELASTPSVKLDIPFLANHDGWDIDSVLGSVRSASYNGDTKELTFTVGISARDKAQEMFKLVAEGHLDNAFSIGWRGGAYNPDTKTYTDGEMLEVSLVTRGCNYDARVVETKGTDATRTKIADPADVNGDQPNAEPAEAPEVPDEPAEVVPDQTNNNDKSAEAEQEKEKSTMDGKETNQAEIAKKQVLDAPSQKSVITTTDNAKAYLDSPEAMADLTKHIHDSYGQSAEAVMAGWKSHLATKGLTGSEILPTTLSQAFFNCFERKDGVLAKFRSTKVLAGAAYAFSTSDKAGAHTKGDKKGYITPKSLRRDWKHKIAYAKMELDLQDLLDDQTGELTVMRAEMLAERLYTRILEAFVTEPVAQKPTSGADTRMFDGVRGVFSFKADLDRAKGTGTEDIDLYAKAVATVVANVADDNIYDKIVKSLRSLKGAGEKAIFVPEGTMTGLMLSKDTDGRYLFAPGSDTEKLLKASVVELETMTDSGYDVIAVNCGNILYSNGADMLRAAFDHDYNRDVLLHEKPVAGTAQGWKSIAGYATATAAAKA